MWHSGQHTRQLQWVLEGLNIPVDGPLPGRKCGKICPCRKVWGRRKDRLTGVVMSSHSRELNCTKALTRPWVLARNPPSSSSISCVPTRWKAHHSLARASSTPLTLRRAIGRGARQTRTGHLHPGGLRSIGCGRRLVPQESALAQALHQGRAAWGDRSDYPAPL